MQRSILVTAEVPRSRDRLAPRHFVDIAPALQESLADAVHACIGSMIRVRDVVEHLLSVPAVGGCEGLVPFREDEGLGVGGRVLSRRRP